MDVETRRLYKEARSRGITFGTIKMVELLKLKC